MADPRDGLEWVPAVIIEKPRWTREPALDAVHALVQSELNEEQGVKVTFHSEGGFNKIYTVESASKLNMMLRVSLPRGSSIQEFERGGHPQIRPFEYFHTGSAAHCF